MTSSNFSEISRKIPWKFRRPIFNDCRFHIYVPKFTKLIENFQILQISEHPPTFCEMVRKLQLCRLERCKSVPVYYQQNFTMSMINFDEILSVFRSFFKYIFQCIHLFASLGPRRRALRRARAGSPCRRASCDPKSGLRQDGFLSNGTFI